MWTDVNIGPCALGRGIGCNNFPEDKPQEFCYPQNIQENITNALFPEEILEALCRNYLRPRPSSKVLSVSPRRKRAHESTMWIKLWQRNSTVMPCFDVHECGKKSQLTH